MNYWWDSFFSPFLYYQVHFSVLFHIDRLCSCLVTFFLTAAEKKKKATVLISVDHMILELSFFAIFLLVVVLEEEF